MKANTGGTAPTADEGLSPHYLPPTRLPSRPPALMRFDLGMLIAILMLVIWAVGALVYSGPGWLHLLLTGGLSLLIWRIVERSEPR